MSDRVRFLTNNDNASGCSGFPFPTIAAPPTGEEAYYPRSLTLAQTIRWWWRVRTWNLVTDLSVTQNNGSDSQTTTLAGGDGGALAGRELHLTRRTDQASLWDHVAAGPGASAGNLALALFGNTANALVKDGDNYYPRLVLAGSLESLVFTPNETAQIQFSSAGIADATGTIVATVDGLPVPVQYKHEPDSEGSSFAGTTIVITPASYWPYAGADGLPIYDTATGALLPDRTPLL